MGDLALCGFCRKFEFEDESGYGYCARFGRFTHYSRLCDGEQAGRRKSAENAEKKLIFKT